MYCPSKYWNIVILLSGCSL